MRKQTQAPRGFTLVELLLAMTISTLILGATYAAFVTANNAWEKSRAAAEQYQSARVALTLLERHLRAALAPNSETGIEFIGENSLDEFETEVLGEMTLDEEGPQSDTLRFASSGAPILAGGRHRSDITQFEFYLDEATETIPSSLMMLVAPLPNALAASGLVMSVQEQEEEYETSTLVELAPNVASFDVIYHDGTDWVEEWSDAKALPTAVEVRLILIDPLDLINARTFSRLIVIEAQAPTQAPADDLLF